MRVVHICQRDDPATGGAVRVAVEYVQRLPEHGIDAHGLFLYGPPGPFGAQLAAGHAHYLGLRSSSDLLRFGRLVRFLSEFQPRLIHHHDGLLWPQLLTFFHPGIVKVVQMHIAPRGGSPWARGRLADWLQYRSADMLLFVSNHGLQQHSGRRSCPSGRVQLIYNGVDRLRFRPPTGEERSHARSRLGLPDGVQVVGFVGRLECRTKGADDFLRAIALLPGRFWGLVAGSGPDAGYLRGLAGELGISDRVIFAGLLEDPVMGYHCMDVFCLTSHIEELPLVVAEAMACSIPVVGLRCEGGVGELLTPETGRVVPKRDVKELANAVAEAANREGRWAQRLLAAEALLREQHDWCRNTRLLARLYGRLAGSTPEE